MHVFLFWFVVCFRYVLTDFLFLFYKYTQTIYSLKYFIVVTCNSFDLPYTYIITYLNNIVKCFDLYFTTIFTYCYILYNTIIEYICRLIIMYCYILIEFFSNSESCTLLWPDNILIVLSSYNKGGYQGRLTPPSTNGGERDYMLVHGVLYMANEGS